MHSCRAPAPLLVQARASDKVAHTHYMVGIREGSDHGCAIARAHGVVRVGIVFGVKLKMTPCVT